MINRISLIGLGAIGSAYASRLHKMNPKALKVIVDENRKKRYSENGIFINGERYDFNYVQPEEKVEPADLVLIAVKYDGLDQALIDLKHHIGENTIIVSLMNGIASEDVIAQAYGDKNLLYAMCVAIDAVRADTSVTFSNIGRICFGEANNTTLSSNVEKVKQLFELVDIPYEIPEDMQHTMWWKFMINVGVNQTSAVLKAPYQVFQEIPEAREFMNSAMLEVITLAQKKGISLTNDDLTKFHSILMDLSPTGKTSMLQDIEAGRKTEVDYLAGTVKTVGKQLQIPTPINDMLYNMIRTMEKKQN